MNFVWQSDDSTPTYFNWRSGEPNNKWGSDDEDCVRIWRTSADQEVQWNDNPCYLGGGRAICQK